MHVPPNCTSALPVRDCDASTRSVRCKTSNDRRPFQSGARSRSDMMATPSKSAPSGKSYFEQQRELLVEDVAASLEGVLQNINKLNRSLEGIIAVCSVRLRATPYLTCAYVAIKSRLATSSARSSLCGLNSKASWLRNRTSHEKSNQRRKWALRRPKSEEILSIKSQAEHE